MRNCLLSWGEDGARGGGGEDGKKFVETTFSMESYDSCTMKKLCQVYILLSRFVYNVETVER